MLGTLEWYLIIINVLSFLLLTYDYYTHDGHDGITKFDIVLFVFVIIGGAIGETLSYQLLDRDPEFGDYYNRSFRDIRDSILSWRTFTYLIAVIQVVMYVDNKTNGFSNISFIKGYSNNKYVIVYYVLINIITFITYAIDKMKAESGDYRIKNKTLLALAFIGGAFGALFSMIFFKHKIKKLYYVICVPIAMIFHIYLLLIMFNII